MNESQKYLTLLRDGNVIQGRNIEDAWRNAMWCCSMNGKDYTVQKGSYEGQIRRQLPYATILIEQPWQRPLAVTMPEGSGIPSPTSEDKIHEYFEKYIVGAEKAPHEDYTYGQYIMQQLDKAIEILVSSGGGTNQSTITIGEPASIGQDDPPCLRVISFKVIDKVLQMTVYFRSWDLFAGFPENLGGLQLLKEYVLMHLPCDIEDGAIVAFSDGLHLYEQYFPLIESINIRPEK